MNKGVQEVGRQGGKGPVKETTNKEEQEEGRIRKGGTVKETLNKGEQRGGRTEKKCPFKGRASENYKATPVWCKRMIDM